MSDGVVMYLDLTGEAHEATVGHSHRATTSSRFPGVLFQGTVQYRLRKLVRCPDCGQLRYASPHPHAPLVQPGGEVRDCAGRKL